MKKAILAVSFGSTHDHAIRNSIEALEQDIRISFPDYDVFRAFTSERIVRILERRGIAADPVETALGKLADAGYHEVILQPTHLLGGLEYDKLCAAAERFRGSFRILKTGVPLMNTDADIEKICRIFAGEYPGKDAAVVFMGHGTEHSANRMYIEFARLCSRPEYNPFHLVTLDGGFPLDGILPALKTAEYRELLLVPLLFVAGDHANRDMAGDQPDSLKSRLEAEGFAVTPVLRGMGEYREIRALYLEHLREIL